MENMRYRIKCGKFGTYFYDSTDDQELTLQDVLRILNRARNLEEICSECDKELGKGATDYCYSCCLHEGLISN